MLFQNIIFFKYELLSAQKLKFLGEPPTCTNNRVDFIDKQNDLAIWGCDFFQYSF